MFRNDDWDHRGYFANLETGVVTPLPIDPDVQRFRAHYRALPPLPQQPAGQLVDSVEFKGKGGYALGMKWFGNNTSPPRRVTDKTLDRASKWAQVKTYRLRIIILCVSASITLLGLWITYKVTTDSRQSSSPAGVGINSNAGNVTVVQAPQSSPVQITHGGGFNVSISGSGKLGTLVLQATNPPAQRDALTAEAHFQSALWLYTNGADPLAHSEALEHCSASVLSNYPPAMNLLGYWYWKGEVVNKPDLTQARHLWNRAGNLSNAAAFYWLGITEGEAQEGIYRQRGLLTERSSTSLVEQAQNRGFGTRPALEELEQSRREWERSVRESNEQHRIRGRMDFDTAVQKLRWFTLAADDGSTNALQELRNTKRGDEFWSGGEAVYVLRRDYPEIFTKMVKLVEPARYTKATYQMAVAFEREGAKALPSGLEYKVVNGGSGPIPTSNSAVTVHWTVRGVGGEEEDSSYRRGQPSSFYVTNVTDGVGEALLQMALGSKWELLVGFTNNAGGDVMLIADLELLAATNRYSKSFGEVPPV